MTYTVTVKDQATGAPIPAAYINFIMQGTTLMTLATDGNGQIQLDDSTDSGLIAPGVEMTVGVAGYKTFTGNASVLTPTTPNYTVSLTKGVGTGVIVGIALIAGILLLK